MTPGYLNNASKANYFFSANNETIYKANCTKLSEITSINKKLIWWTLKHTNKIKDKVDNDLDFSIQSRHLIQKLVILIAGSYTKKCRNSNFHHIIYFILKLRSTNFSTYHFCSRCLTSWLTLFIDELP